jgi:hypothetical protein
MESISLAGLLDSERAFKLDSGELAVVDITRRTDTPDEHSMAVEINARIVDASGATVTLDDFGTAVPLKLPAKVHTIHKSAIAEGAVNFFDELASQTVDACDRLRKHAVALRSFLRVPVA